MSSWMISMVMSIMLTSTSRRGRSWNFRNPSRLARTVTSSSVPVTSRSERRRSSISRRGWCRELEPHLSNRGNGGAQWNTAGLHKATSLPQKLQSPELVMTRAKSRTASNCRARVGQPFRVSSRKRGLHHPGNGRRSQRAIGAKRPSQEGATTKGRAATLRMTFLHIRGRAASGGLARRCRARA
jgi:hypothetical protein